VSGLKKIKRTIHVLVAASFLDDFCCEIVHPVWPFFVMSVLGANMAILGFIDGLGDAIKIAFAAELSAVELRASTHGGFQPAIGLCALRWSFIAGILCKKVNSLPHCIFPSR